MIACNELLASHAYAICAAGLHLRHFYTDSSILDFKDGPFRISLLAVSEAQLFWPSWQRQVLELHITGLELELTQRHMPTVRLHTHNNCLS